jgi:hypothetical protein
MGAHSAATPLRTAFRRRRTSRTVARPLLGVSGMNDILETASWSEANAPPVDHRFEIAAHEGIGQRCLRSRVRVAKGEVLIPFRAAAVHARPSRMTVQISERQHIELSPAFLELVNHGCAPNVAFDVEAWALIALAPIAPGDELTFFYPSTEWAMAAPFDCRCGAERCLGRVAGASQVPAEVLVGHRLAPHIARLVAGARGDRR